MTTETYDKKPKFDPNKKFTAVEETKPAFDPSKPFEEIKKKGGLAGSASASAGTGKDGLVPLNVDTDAVRAFVTGKPVEQVKQEKLEKSKAPIRITNAITQVKDTKPTEESIESEAQKKIQNISDDDLTDPIKGINKLSQATPKDILATEKAKKILIDRMVQDGFDAKEMLNRSFFGGTSEDNQTARILRERAANYDKNVAPLRELEIEGDLSQANPEFLDYNFKDKIYSAAVQSYAEKNSNFRKELEASGFDAKDFINIRNQIPDGKMGMIMAEYLSDPDVRTFLQKENPNLIPAFIRVQDTLLKDNKNYAINQVANKVSKAVQESGFNNIDPIVNYYGDTHKEVANLTAKEILSPEELDVWNKYVKDNQEQYMDAPSLMQRIAEGGEGVYKGMANTFTEPFRSASESTRNRWEKEASHVSADPKGIFKVIADTGHVLGLVAAIAGTGNVLGGSAGLGVYSSRVVPALSGGVLPFAGDMLEQGRSKYPDSPVKAWTSALFNTAMYTALSQHLFPAKNINQAISKVKPEMDNIVERLANGKITREAARQEANTTFKKAYDFTTGSLGKAAKITGELTGIKMFDRGMDAIFMDNDTYNKFHQPEKDADEALGLFLSNIALGGLSKYGEMKKRNRLAEESYYALASNPKKFERIIDNLSIDKSFGTINEFKENLRYIAQVKKEMDALKINPKDQKRFLFESLKDKAAKAEAEKTTDPTIQQQSKEVAKQAKEIKEKILAGEDADKIVTESEQKEIDEQEETKLKIERLEKDNELDNKKFDAQRKDLDGRNPDDKLKIEEIEEKRKRANEDYERELSKLKPPTEEESLLKELKSKAGEFEKGESLQYFIDKAGEAPDQYIKKYGEKTTKKLLDQVPTEQLKKNLDDLLNISPENPNVKILDQLIESREAAITPEPIEKPKTEGTAENVVPSTSVIMPGEIKQPETITIKPKEDAISKQVSDEMDVRQQTPNGEGVGKGDIQSQEPTRKEKEGKGTGEEAGIGEPPISEPPKGGGVFSERPPTELSHRGLQDVANEFSLSDVKTRDTKSDVQLRQDARETVTDWAEKGEYAKNVGKLVEKAEGGDILTDKERVILEGHLANVSQELRDMNPTSKEFDAKLAEIKRLKDAGERTRSEAGAALRIPSGGSRPKDIADALVEEMDITKSEILTDQQKETVIREFKEETAAEKAWREKYEQLKEERDNREAQNEVTKIAKTKTKEKKNYTERRQKLKDRLKEEFDDYKKSINKVGIKADGGAEATIISAKMAKTILEIAKEYIEEGAVKLADAVKKTFDEVRGIVPDITERDIRDVIAGKYSEQKTRSELAIKLQDLRTEQNLLDKLESLEKGELPKSEKKKRRRNKDITDLRNKLKGVKSKYDAENKDYIRLQAYKDKMKLEIEKISNQIKKGDFSAPKKPEPIKMTTEAIKIKDRLIKIRNEKKLRQLKEFYKNQTDKDKAIRAAIEVANIPRSIMASMDFSALLRQAIIPTIARPRTAIRFEKGRFEGSIPEMFRGAKSQRYYERWFDELSESPDFDGMKKSGLAITDSTDPNLKAREEAFMSSLAERIPFLGTRGIKGSQRAYSIALNKIRVDMYRRFADSMRDRGLTEENSPEAYKHVAQYINNATGRGDVHGILEKAAPVLNAIFFSPRLIASRINMMTFLAQAPFKKQLPKEVIRAYLADTIKFVGIGIGIMALAKYGLGAEVEDDPRSSDFGKIKDGNTRWDIWGGFQQYARVIAQMISGERKSTTTGQIQKLDGKGAFGDDKWDVLGTMGRGKLAPVPSMVVDLISGKNIIGEKIKLRQWIGEVSDPTNSGKASVGAGEYIGQHVLPLNATGLWDALQDRGVKAMFDVLIPSTFGIGVQTYEPKKPSPASSKSQKPTKETKQSKPIKTEKN